MRQKARSRSPILLPFILTATAINGRMLVNHRRLPGELSFLITIPREACEIQRLVSPIEVREEDFVLLERGMSIQRTVDLAGFL